LSVPEAAVSVSTPVFELDPVQPFWPMPADAPTTTN
jgi:hypothetical protein